MSIAPKIKEVDDGHIIRSKWNYQFTNEFSFRFIGQYDAVAGKSEFYLFADLEELVHEFYQTVWGLGAKLSHSGSGDPPNGGKYWMAELIAHRRTESVHARVHILRGANSRIGVNDCSREHRITGS
jgi:hypothetical protein